MFELSREFRFEAAHTLQRDLAIDPDIASSRRIHGHSYLAVVTLRGAAAPATGMVMDLGALDRIITVAKDALDHRLLDDVPGLGPATIENLSVWIWRRLAPDCEKLVRVTVSRPSVGDSCSYQESSAF